MSGGRVRAGVAVTLALALAGCGGEDERDAPRATPTAPAGGVDVRVIMRDAPGPPSYRARCAEAGCVRRWERLLAGAQNRTRVCTEVYGGPETARIRGTAGGQTVNVRVDRTNGCGISDYEELFRLIGRPAPIRG